MKRAILLICVLGVICYSISAQSFLTPDDYLINGYSKKLSGLDFDYQSCIPGFRESMLLRATSGKDFIEWETEPAPSHIGKKYATFIWVAALGSSPGKARMDLSVDGKNEFSFYTDGLPSWDIKGSDRSILSFNSILVDQNGDNHGYMILRIPADRIVSGKSLLLKVSGSHANLTSWYMTFKKPVKTGVSMNPYPAIIRKGNSQLQLVEVAIFYFGNKTAAKIYADGKLIDTTTLKFGYNSVNLGLPQVSKPASTELKVIVGNLVLKNTVALEPVRKWKIDFIQHTHTDIGYTRICALSRFVISDAQNGGADRL